MILLSIVGSAVALMRYAVLRSMLPGAPKAVLHSLEVADLIGGTGVDKRFKAVAAALDLIAEKDPRRLGRLRNDIRGIVFLETGPEYWPRGRLVILHDISSLTLPQIALLLVHEAIHARLSNAGIGYDPERRVRVEAVCVRQELQFLRLLPEEGELVGHTKAKLESPWWSDDALRHRHRDTLQSAGAPRWLTWLYERQNREFKGRGQ